MSADLLALISLLLAYPDEVVCASRAAVAAGVEGVAPSPAAGKLKQFCQWWVGMDPLALQQMYVATFDTRRSSTLYMTYPAHGDTPERGEALLELKRLYGEAGFTPATAELPDYLPAICQFAALAPAPAATRVLELAAAGVKATGQGLAKQKSPYAWVLAALDTIIEKETRS